MPGDVVDLIMQDHREVERLFDELKDSPEKRPNLLPVLTTLLTGISGTSGLSKDKLQQKVQSEAES